jgi:hypothetical protein
MNEEDKLKLRCMVLMHANGGWIQICAIDIDDQKHVNSMGAKMGRALAKKKAGSLVIMTLAEQRKLTHWSAMAR